MSRVVELKKEKPFGQVFHLDVLATKGLQNLHDPIFDNHFDMHLSHKIS